MKSGPQPCCSYSRHSAQPPSPAGEAKGSHPDGEVRKNPPSAFHPRQEGSLLRERATGPGKRESGKEHTHKLRAGWGGVGKGPREALTPSCFPHGTRKGGTQHTGFPQALGNRSPQRGPSTSIDFSLRHGPAVRAPKSSGGGVDSFYSILPQYVPLPSRILCEEWRSGRE